MTVLAPLPTRLATHLQSGLSVESAAAREGISAGLGQIIVDDLVRRGLMTSAGTLCASGLGACGGGTGQGVDLLCAGCPLAVK